MEHIVELGAIVTGFNIAEQCIDGMCGPCSEITLWNKGTLERKREINTPLKLSGCTHIENDSMYICSRNILGIDRIKLSE